MVAIPGNMLMLTESHIYHLGYEGCQYLRFRADRWSLLDQQKLITIEDDARIQELEFAYGNLVSGYDAEDSDV